MRFLCKSNILVFGLNYKYILMFIYTGGRLKSGPLVFKIKSTQEDSMVTFSWGNSQHHCSFSQASNSPGFNPIFVFQLYLFIFLHLHENVVKNKLRAVPDTSLLTLPRATVFQHSKWISGLLCRIRKPLSSEGKHVTLLNAVIWH